MTRNTMTPLLKRTSLIVATSIVLTGYSKTAFAQTKGTGNVPPSTTSSTTNANQPPAEIFVNVHAKQSDVRDVLTDLFGQAKKNFVIDPNVHYVLWLNLTHVDFDQALDLICHTAHLQYKKEDGIWKVSVRPTPAMITTMKTSAAVFEAKKPPAPVYTSKYLSKIITTRMQHVLLRSVYASLSKQAGIPIFVDSKIPDYKVDAYLLHTSLHYALVKLDQAAGLEYTLASNGLHVYLKKPLVGVSLVQH